MGAIKCLGKCLRIGRGSPCVTSAFFFFSIELVTGDYSYMISNKSKVDQAFVGEAENFIFSYAHGFISLLSNDH